MADDLTFDLMAGVLRADSQDNATFLQVLAEKLEGALPGRVKVRRAGGLLHKSHPVVELTVELGGERFTLASPAPGRLDATCGKVVRNIVLKSEGVGLAEWIDALSAALVAEADRSEAARRALERLLL